MLLIENIDVINQVGVRLTKVENVINHLKKDNLLDFREIFVYATSCSVIEGIVGAITGLVLITVFHDNLYILRSNFDNSYGECLGRFYISELHNIKGSAGIFGSRFSFEANGKKYRFKLPSRANRFVNYFMKD